jgi:hypothetical protein
MFNQGSAAPAMRLSNFFLSGARARIADAELDNG